MSYNEHFPNHHEFVLFDGFPEVVRKAIREQASRVGNIWEVKMRLDRGISAEQVANELRSLGDVTI